jgi:hypothetical protein
MDEWLDGKTQGARNALVSMWFIQGIHKKTLPTGQIYFLFL